MTISKTIMLVATLALVSSTSFAQNATYTDSPSRATTADPNSAPMMGREGSRDRTTGRGLDSAGRANTSDPNSAMSSGTDASGHTVNPMADPRQR